jgi:methionyl-tRNA formyltransferase
MSKKNIILIGGGDLLFSAAKKLKKYNPLVLISNRHAKENLLNNISLEKNLKKNNFQFYIIDNVNSRKNKKKYLKKNYYVFCFGPDWIFDDEIVTFYKNRIYNFNNIPIPKYLGWAHFTWQILNQNKESALFIQKIDKKINQGNIIYKKKFKLKLKKNPKPIDYFQENTRLCSKEIINFFRNFMKGNIINESFRNYYNQRYYFRKLQTRKDAAINWSWSSNDIAKFCNAFDNPYQGAFSEINKKKVILKNVKLFKREKFHPFANGNVLRKVKNKVYVCCFDGILEVSKIICFKTKKNFLENIRDGDEFKNLN